MTKKARLPMNKHHVLIFDEDWEFLDRHYGPSSESRYGISSAIREIVHAKVNGLKAKMNAELDKRMGHANKGPSEGDLEQ